MPKTTNSEMLSHYAFLLNIWSTNSRQNFKTLEPKKWNKKMHFFPLRIFETWGTFRDLCTIICENVGIRVPYSCTTQSSDCFEIKTMQFVKQINIELLFWFSFTINWSFLSLGARDWHRHRHRVLYGFLGPVHLVSPHGLLCHQNWWVIRLLIHPRPYIP